ncbi:MAG: hypothetical protein A2621_03165 [Alphaproteobacteria bacterium RIFCSPHIGHO2_01_FULL_41_14]|nr:MAG: hypothetical protein A3K20_01280 [Alphaproteobacteria bacterium GWA1_45_9]OFW89866.1 MAG: hypothetical protein A2621_03165 [Alphaproteobacteria bacterium RIFCSPHIGHO2_01_FULL_41_14]
MVKPLRASLLFGLFLLAGCLTKERSKPTMAPYVIKKVTSAPIELPVMIVYSTHGTKTVHPSVWNAKTLKFSGGMPQEVVVQKGDSLFTISQKYAVPLPLIIEKNKIKPPFAIRPGQTLILVGPQVHIAQKGEDLHKIAQLHQVSLSTLGRQNKLLGDQPLQPGQPLILPASQNLTPPSSLSSPKEEGFLPPLRRKLSSEKHPLLLSQTPRRSGSKFEWPVKGQLISKFGSKGQGLYNDGINIATTEGTKVRAAENGMVVYSGNDIKSYGNLILVKHGGGWMSAYAHLDKAVIQKGQVVKRHEVIGHVGMSGLVTHPQLHFELRKKGKPVDPLSQLV